MKLEKARPLIIIGSGPAAHTAAIYGGRAHLNPLMFEGLLAGGVPPGGQLTTTTEVENFPGFPKGISGSELMDLMRRQSVNCGAEILTKTVDRVDLSKRPFQVFVGNEAYLSDTMIIATGATARRLGVTNEEHLWQKGISACAVCDGALPIFRDQIVYVIGGGDTACEEAAFLTKYAREVNLVHRRDQLRASKAMQERIFRNKKIKVIWNHELMSVEGGQKLEELVLKNNQTDELKKFEAGGLFYAVGHIPNTRFLKGQLEMDLDGYLLTQPGTTQTSMEGIFAAGDVQDKKFRQAITSAGTGCMALMEAEKFLSL